MLTDTFPTAACLKNARETIIDAFQAFEPTFSFQRKNWDYKGTGGGQMAVIRGKVFEKAAVNFSHIGGDCFPMQDGSGPFTACGISLITHMQNPYVPTAHMNVRLIQTTNGYWIGGGYDLTPMPYIEPEDIAHFHGTAKACLDLYGPSFYPQFKENADTYFFIPHRNKTRGVGGIFFDHFTLGDLETDLNFLEAITTSFLKALVPLIEKYKDTPYTTHDKQKQNELRAHYVEFNLLYDRGTRFGFLSQGNPEAILCSMPPVAHW